MPFLTPQFFTKRIFKRPVVEVPRYNLDQKIILGSALWLLLAINFTLNYLTYTYYSEDLLKMYSPGSWLFIINNIFLVGILIFVRRSMRWKWSDLGLGKPANWWQLVVMSIISFGSLILFSRLVQPAIIETFGPHQNISYLYTIQNDLPRLITVMIAVWITSAFLEEIIFRSFIINTLDELLGKTPLSTFCAVLASAVIFGGIHAYQGMTGILTTFSIGLIFGGIFILNGRRLWPLILVHGIIDSISLWNIYKS